MRWYAGTSGYSYPEWRGAFYPEDVAPEGMLAFYASRLPAVEINNTFYRMPRDHVVEAWRDAVPDTFRFAVKASRRITHQARLKDAAEPVAYLAARLERLEDKLGCVLLQLPPYLRKDAPRLDAFLAAWPAALPAAVEFRHPSWLDDEVRSVLERHRAALCVSEGDGLPLPPYLATTDWVYLRLRKAGYERDALRAWRQRVEDTGAETGYAFFKHEDAGGGPALCATFLALASSPSPPTR